MQSHGTGPITGNRQGALVTAQTGCIKYAQTITGNSDFRLITIEASPAVPVALRLRAVVTVAFADGGADTLSVGTAQGGAQLLNAVDVKAAAGTNYKPTNDVVVYTARTAIWARVARAGAPGQFGEIVLIAELFDVNITVPNNNAV